jgi:hypothetical protein
MKPTTSRVTLKLKSVEFYQSVRLWDNSEYKSVHAATGLSIELIDHLVILSTEGQEDTIVVPTANMRHGKIGPEAQPEPVDPTPLIESSGAPEVSTPETTISVKCVKHCTFSRAMNQPVPRICTKCGSPEESKTK